MRSILEKAFVHLLNEQHDKAEELFHQFMVGRARQIHESNRQGDDYVLEENWDDEITTESYFTEEDLADLEDGDGEGEEDSEGDDDFAGDDAGEKFGDEDEVKGDEDVSGDEAGDEFGDENVGGEEGGEEAVEDRIEDLEDQIEKLTAEFESMMDALGDGDADADDGFGDKDDLGDDDASDDFGGEEGDEEDLAGGLEDDMEDEDAAHMESLEEGDDEDCEEELEEEFDDITESIIDELEKVTVTLADGKEVGNGSGFTQNKSAAIPQKNKDARQGGAPIKMKAKSHKGFERETAPAVADMKARRNTKKTADEGQSKVSKEGDKSAEINKLNSDANNKSLL